jgi:imidazolonepropionase-like amidohydrolase
LTATINPARLFNETDISGSVASGKRADLLLLNADPLESIENTSNIFAVVNNGQLLSETDIKKRLDTLKENQSAASKQ